MINSRPHFQNMEVFALSTGELLGTIEQQCVCCFFQAARFNILDDVGNLVIIIKAPYCTTSCCGNVTFDVSCNIVNNFQFIVFR